jgi:hypothetical protein
VLLFLFNTNSHQAQSKKVKRSQRDKKQNSTAKCQSQTNQGKIKNLMMLITKDAVTDDDCLKSIK